MTAPAKRDPSAAQVAAVIAPDGEFAGWTRHQLLTEVRKCEQEETRLGMRRLRARRAVNRLPLDDTGGDG